MQPAVLWESKGDSQVANIKLSKGVMGRAVRVLFLTLTNEGSSDVAALTLSMFGCWHPIDNTKIGIHHSIFLSTNQIVEKLWNVLN